MRGYRLYDITRGLTAAVAAGVAGLLLWAATLIGQQSPGTFWASTGVVAGAGLVVAVSQAVTGWTKGLRLRLSRGTILLAVAPAFVCVGWIMVASQPGGGFGEASVVSWSRDVGLLGLMHDLALWHGVLAFGFGLVAGLSLDAVPEPPPATAGDEVAPAAAPAVEDRELVDTLEQEPRRAPV